MRSLPVVVSDVLPQGPLKVTFAPDKDVIQALPADGPHEALREGVCPGRADRRADDTPTLGSKYLIKRPRVVGVAVTDQEAAA